MPTVDRADNVLNEFIEDLDEHFRLHNGSRHLAFASLSKAEQEFVDGEIERCMSDTRYYLENYHCIKTELGTVRTLYPMWDSQEIFLATVFGMLSAGLQAKILVLKARQLGLSTLSQGLMFQRTIFMEGVHSMIVAQDPGQSGYLFGMSRLAYDMLPWWMRPEERYNAKDKYLVFDVKDQSERQTNPGLRSAIYVEAANKMCLCPGTAVPTPSGVVPIETIEEGDFVYAPTGKPIRVVAALKKKSLKNTGTKLTLWHTGAFPISGTDDHPIIAENGLTDLSKLKKGDFVPLPFREISSGGDCPGPKMSDWAMVRLKRSLHPQANMDWGFLCGLYLAEGSVSRDNGAAVSFALSVKEHELARRAARASGVPLSKPIERGGSLVYRLHSSWLGTWLAQEFGRCDEKKIPDWVFGFGYEFCLGLLEGMLVGDGHFCKKRNDIIFVTVRQTLAVQIRELALSLGFGLGSINEVKTTWTHDGLSKHGKAYRVEFGGAVAAAIRSALGKDVHECKTHLRNSPRWKWVKGANRVLVQVKKVEPCKIDDVYDITVDSDDHLYLLPAAITHNTGVSVGKTIRTCHLSEISDWGPYAGQIITTQIEPTMNAPDLLAIMESTARGKTGYWWRAYKDAMEGRGEWRPVFIPFFRVKKYSTPIPKDEKFELTEEEAAIRKNIESQENFTISDETFNWRRKRIENFKTANNGDEWLFYQEYPLCLTGDVRVSTEQGIIPIRDAALATETESGPVKHWIPQSAGPVFKLVTAAGREIRGTYDHPVMTNRGWVKMGDLQPGEIIDLRPPMFSRSDFRLETHPVPGATLSVQMDDDWGLLLGYFMGDGCWYKTEFSVACDERDKDVHEEVKRLAASLIGTVSTKAIGKKRGAKGCRYILARGRDEDGRSAAAPILRNLGVIERQPGSGNHKRRVCVPECIWRSTRPVVKAFISALFECDGAVTAGTVRFYTKHSQFARDIQLLLLGFGINVRIVEVKKEAGSGKRYIGYELVFSRANSELFMQEIGFRGVRKCSNDCSLRPGAGRKAATLSMTDVVDSVIEDGFEATYDFTMDTEEHAFSAAGILTHNTWREAFQASGMCAFNKKKLHEMTQTTCLPPIFYGEAKLKIERPNKSNPDYVVKKPTFKMQKLKPGQEIPNQSTEGNRLFVWEDYDPNYKYYIGADVAHGIQGGDYSCAAVIKLANKPYEPDVQVAEWHGWINPTPFASVLAALGWHYGTCEIACETNDIGRVVNNELLRSIEYPNLFQWKHYDKLKNFMTDFFGWQTTHKTRPELVSKMKEAIDDKTLLIRSEATIDELMSFSSIDGGRFEGQDTNDDRVFALMIAYFCAHDMDWGKPHEGPGDAPQRDKSKDFYNSDYSPIYDNPQGLRHQLVVQDRVAPADYLMYSDLGVGEGHSRVDEDDIWKLT